MSKPIQLERRHFEFIANEIAPLLASESAVYELAWKLIKTNPKFESTRFIERALKARANNKTGE